eukprot:CAMPEP_0117763012 /NCGR_PEP_ID=MMETSP0947-20121206/18339_1 /TAXON_ID=44440 /ORGANISM="Chattonella subsalsa, Strain CCMP2191" /LENGTH=540 /DNA_ID=CAMNT_0005584547 /DNA_START=77 /DNA_END=1699 /DNA_ORIENTATION=+
MGSSQRSTALALGSFFAVYFMIMCKLASDNGMGLLSKASVVLKQPNIVFILADDLGWSDLGFQQAQDVPNMFTQQMKTPVIDQLAAEGVVFDSHYVHPMCTPTRAAFMSGKYASNVGLQHHVILGNQASGLPLSEKTLPQLLQQKGYSTHMIGKWHLGFHKWEYTPTQRGFDSFFGYHLGAGDYYNHSSCGWLDENGIQTHRSWGYDFWLNKVNIAKELENIFSMDLYAKEAERIINMRYADGSSPMFLYLALQAPHTPLTPVDEDLKLNAHFTDPKRQRYAGLVHSLDRVVGRVQQALKRANMWDNTILIFSSDNGGSTEGGGYNWPLRGEKETLWEGGTKAVSFVHGGGTSLLKKTGYRYNGLLHITDWLPTLLHLAGGMPSELPDNLDGHDVWDAISKGGVSPRDLVLYNVDDKWGCGAVRSGKWKYVRNGNCNKPKLGWWKVPPEVSAVERPSPPTPEDGSDDLWLINLEEDPLESNNLADEFPEIVQEMQTLLQHYLLIADTNQNAENSGDEMADPKMHDNTWVPWNSIDTSQYI